MGLHGDVHIKSYNEHPPLSSAEFHTLLLVFSEPILSQNNTQIDPVCAGKHVGHPTLEIVAALVSFIG